MMNNMYVKNNGVYIMNSNIKNDKKCYLENIKKELIVKYCLSEADALMKLEKYDYLNEIIKSDRNYFFYQSPEYWADFLME